MNKFEQFQSRVEQSLKRVVIATIIGASALTLAACGSEQPVGAEPTPAISQPEVPPAPTAGPTTAPNTVAPIGYGYDVSFPQCGTALPEPGSFAIVGANEYLPTIPNPCFDELAAWGEQSTRDTDQPKLAAYVTAANPGDQHVPTWPAEGKNKYGACTGADTQACAYEYGQDRIAADLQTIGGRAKAGFKVWIDVEPEYSWESNTDGRQRNTAVLEGMVEALQHRGLQTGFYSSPAIWRQIVGTTPVNSSLRGLDNWMLGAHSEAEARTNCQTPSFTEGKVTVAQFTTDGLDRDVAC